MFAYCGCGAKEKTPLTNEELYAAAVEDAKVCEAGEIAELVELSDGENLLISWNNFPDEFEVGGAYTPYAEVEIWCVSYEELRRWCGESGEGVDDWTERLEQLIGLPEGMGYTHFAAFAVTPEDVIRPAYQPDP